MPTYYIRDVDNDPSFETYREDEEEGFTVLDWAQEALSEFQGCQDAAEAVVDWMRLAEDDGVDLAESPATLDVYDCGGGLYGRFEAKMIIKWERRIKRID